ELEIDGEKITIAPVDIFPSVPERNTIYLKLSTIHKMHDELNSSSLKKQTAEQKIPTSEQI
ncbi:hypothetical protein ONO57_27215, partial [Salmonella enterica subsp. enterica serovar Anatum]|nr:hypothetical protein [Salmonella enterica subsp. enterica serovar Anatum]